MKVGDYVRLDPEAENFDVTLSVVGVPADSIFVITDVYRGGKSVRVRSTVSDRLNDFFVWRFRPADLSAEEFVLLELGGPWNVG